MSTRKRVIYVAGPFRAADGWEVACNIHRAEEAARTITKLGAMPLTPHSIGAHMERTETDEFWLSGTLELMRRCDAVYVLPGFRKSQGTLGEIEEAKRIGLPIFYQADQSDRSGFSDLSTWLTEQEGSVRLYDVTGVVFQLPGEHRPATLGAEKLDVLLREVATLERVIRRALYVVRSECVEREPSCVMPKSRTLAWAIRKALESVAKMGRDASDKDDAYQLFNTTEVGS